LKKWSKRKLFSGNYYEKTENVGSWFYGGKWKMKERKKSYRQILESNRVTKRNCGEDSWNGRKMHSLTGCPCPFLYSNSRDQRKG
jgi:hypothetical protein